MALGQLIEGKWLSKREQEDSQGRFLRPSTTFRDRITADGSSGFKAESGRYHLYISWACPWAHRTAIMRTLKGLEDAITLSVLEKQRYLCGDSITEADWCMFTTLFRFDAVYYVHFKCNLRHIFEYPNLWNYLLDLYQQPGVKETCNLEYIKLHYYKSHPNVNPYGIVPKGPILDFDTPHNRQQLTRVAAQA